MQALYNLDTFGEKFMQYGTIWNTIITALRNIFRAFDTEQNICDVLYINLRETRIFNTQRFNPDAQEDLNEVFTCLINKINDINEAK